MPRFKYKIFLICLMIGCNSSIASAQMNAALFGSTEFKSTELSAFKKWSSIRTRHQQDTHPKIIEKMPSDCRRTKSFKCASDEWHDIITALRSKPAKIQLDVINRYLNGYSYITDMVNWQQDDYWATIKQFFNKNGISTT